MVNEYHPPMLNPVNKFAARLLLLLILVLLTGVATVSASTPGPLEASCYKSSHQQQTPPPENECADPSCHCPACNASIINSSPLLGSTAQETTKPHWRLSSVLPADYIQRIDYPPEVR